MKFTTLLIGWYKKNKRDLPWRQTRDPYKVWLSEIILQQTRIDQGLDYYNNFVDHFPDVFSLANSTEHDILKLWQGLGYYSRARNLYQTAKKIAVDFNGHFPGNYNALIKLKGIGEYTAAAISSISFNEPRPVVDGNVLRFLSRFEGIKIPVDTTAGKKLITDIALKLIDRKQPGEFNQALMEFGALYCKPMNPDCQKCVFRSDCKAYRKGLVSEVPYKNKQLFQRKRYFYYLVIVIKNKSVYLNQRTGKDIWKNLYDFPLIEKNHKVSLEKIIEEIRSYLGTHLGNKSEITISKEYKHFLTHQLISARFFTISIISFKHYRNLLSRTGSIWNSVGLSDLHKYPVPRLIEKFLKDGEFLID
jgi:A/G-specific adenine glycosylase